MADEFYKAAWGDVRMWLSSVRTAGGRDQVVHDPSRGDVRVIQDRGAELGRVDCGLLFDHMVGDTRTPLEQLQRFRELIKDGKPHLFTHPVEGTFLAVVSTFNYQVQDRNITGECTFLPSDPVQAVTAAPPTSMAAAGDGGVPAAADELDAQLADVGLSSDVPAAARAASDGWLDQAKSAREVLVDVEGMTQQIADEIDAYELEADILLWPALKAYVMLSDALRAGAAAATGDFSQVFQLQIGAPSSLRTLLAKIYGGDQADDRYDEVLGLNDIATPGRVPTGTVLTLPALPAQARRS